MSATKQNTLSAQAASVTAKLRHFWRTRSGMMSGRSKAGRDLQIVESLALGNRRQLFLVRLGEQRFLVGCGTETVTAITAVAQPDGDAAR